MRRIAEWWQTFDMVGFVLGALIVIVMVLGALLIGWQLLDSRARTQVREDADCSEMEDWTVKYLPVRCYEYFGINLVNED